MPLTSAQLQTLKSDIAADGTLSAFPRNSDGDQAIANAYNAPASPNFFVWKTDAAVQDVYDRVVWSALTPTDAIPTDTQLNSSIWQNRAIACQGKQFNLQIIVQGQTRLNASKANIRSGLQDALTNVPSGSGGALVSAGWVPVRDNALARLATRAEKLFAAGGTGANAANSSTMAFEGLVSNQDVDSARNS